MKKIILSFLLGFVSFCVSAQESAKVKDNKAKVETSNSTTKIKKVPTPKQRVHNIIHPKRKKYHKVKVKHEVKKEGE